MMCTCAMIAAEVKCRQNKNVIVVTSKPVYNLHTHTLLMQAHAGGSCCVWWLLTGTTWSDTSSIDDKYGAHPRVPITAVSDVHLVTDVHWNHSSVCVQFQYSAQMCIQPMQAHLLA